MSVFVDTNIFVAAADTGEARNAKAHELLRRIQSQEPFTTDHVVVETWAILRNRGGYPAAERFVDGLRGSAIALEQVTLVDIERAISIGAQWSDQCFDFVDRTSMAAMERLGCSRAATFEVDFAVYRFGPNRRDAFEVLS